MEQLDAAARGVLWRAQQLETFNRDKLPMITKAVVAERGGRDGSAPGDGYPNDPRMRQFDPEVLQRTGADGPTCLTANDLRPFFRRDGKVIMWHGWTDTTLEPRNGVEYYTRVIAAVNGAGNGSDGPAARNALATTAQSMRLFKAPGVNHCGNGPGPNSSFAYTMAATAGPDDPDHDVVAALDQWIDRGTAPERLIAPHFTDGKADETRPICAYPKVSKYRGSGDPTLSDSFACVDRWDQFARDYAAANR